MFQLSLPALRLQHCPETTLPSALSLGYDSALIWSLPPPPWGNRCLQPGWAAGQTRCLRAESHVRCLWITRPGGGQLRRKRATKCSKNVLQNSHNLVWGLDFLHCLMRWGEVRWLNRQVIHIQHWRCFVGICVLTCHRLSNKLACLQKSEIYVIIILELKMAIVCFWEKRY